MPRIVAVAVIAWSEATAALAAAAPGEPAPPAVAGAALTLAAAEAEALARRPALAAARAAVEVAEGQVGVARAGYLPQVALTGSYQRTTGNFAPRPGSLPNPATAGGWDGTTFSYFTFGASASQLIYDFGQTTQRWRAAGASREAARADEVTARTQALLAVRQAYFQAEAADELARVASQTVRNQERHLAQVQGFVRTGIRPDIDVARVRTDLANAKVQLVTAENRQALALALLDQEMGLPAGTTRRLADAGLPEVAGEEDRSGRLVDDALAGRPELASLEQQQRAAELTVRSLRGGYGPALAATAGATASGKALDDLVPNWFAGLALSWPVLQGGATAGQVRSARGQLSAAEARVAALRLQIRVDVQSAQLAVAGAKVSISAAGEALTSARDQLRLAERRYETGLGSVIELGDAELAFGAAAAQEVQARYGLSLARAQLLAAVGRS